MNEKQMIKKLATSIKEVNERIIQRGIENDARLDVLKNPIMGKHVWKINYRNTPPLSVTLVPIAKIRFGFTTYTLLRTYLINDEVKFAERLHYVITKNMKVISHFFGRGNAEGMDCLMGLAMVGERFLPDTEDGIASEPDYISFRKGRIIFYDQQTRKVSYRAKIQKIVSPIEPDSSIINTFNS